MQQLHISYMEQSKKLHMPLLGLALVRLLLLISLVSPASSCIQQEKASLLQFLAALSKDGGLAASWRNSTDCCKWEGITCNPNRVVTDVSLASRGLKGSISPFLGNLTGLLRLNLSLNLLSGGLPPELTSSNSIIVLDVSFNQLHGELYGLPSSTPVRPLQVLNISSNLFTGQFPSTAWKAMENLIALNASNNSFTGQIPTHFCNSPSLVVLELCDNQFSGSISAGIGSCSMLRVLNAGHNNLNGTLPDELFNATALEYLALPNNDLHGVLDGARIINLRNLVTLDLGGNNFSGKIPNSIAELKRLEEVHFDHNNMSGELPSGLSNCTKLITIALESNKFSGELTKVNFSNLHNLRTLDLLYNNFTGRIPESIYSCSNLTALQLSGNNLHGQLSPRIGDLKYLTFLSLAENSFRNITNAIQILTRCRNLITLHIGQNFRGELMPDDDNIDGFENLEILDIKGCELFGNIPLWISKLANLKMLVLSNNQLTGSVPPWIKDLSHLFYLDMSNNSLSGEIPISLMDMPMLKSEETESVYAALSFLYPLPNLLDLSNNKFIGEIPQEIGQLKYLYSLDFSFNGLTGQIPHSIANLRYLQELDLSNNNLAGGIPEALTGLHFLSTFNVSYNDLEGPIPTGGQFDAFLRSSFDGNTKLCGPMIIRKCGSAETLSPKTKAEAPGATILSTEIKTFFVISFCAFFGVGVLYDQVVLSRFFC